MEDQHHSEAVRQLEGIYTDIAQRVRAITEERPLWPCHKGWGCCCRQLAQPPEITAAEWHVVHQGFYTCPR